MLIDVNLCKCCPTPVWNAVLLQALTFLFGRLHTFYHIVLSLSNANQGL